MRRGRGTAGASSPSGERQGSRSSEAPCPPLLWSPRYEVDLGGHVFPTAKYRLVRDRLLAEELLRPQDFEEPRPAGREELARVHSEAYLERVEGGTLTPAEILKLEVPFSRELRDAMVFCCGGTIEAGRRALEEGVAVHLGGGFHHAFVEHGEGFCLLNDVAVGAATLIAEGAAERVLVVDLDVHQGNGTAAIFADEPRVFTFSMHQERNYPHPKPPSDLDVGLPDGMDDAGYLERLREHLPPVLELHRPDLVFYLAGADPYRDDQLGGLGLTIEGLAARDAYVLERCRDEGVGVATLTAGGYAFRESDTVEIHCGTVRAAIRQHAGEAEVA